MALYPYTIQQLDPQGTYEVPAGSLICSEFTLAPNSQLMVSLVRTLPTQDFSLRCWFSKEPGGTSLHINDLIASNWHPNRFAIFSVCVHSNTNPQPNPQLQTYFAPTEPGTYYLNVLNLVNETNQYAGQFVLVTDA